MQRPEKLKAINGAIASALGGDPSVINPSRVMRLAGSIAWPLKPDRKVELVELGEVGKDRPAVYVNGAIEHAYPPVVAATPSGLALDSGIDPVAMLRAVEPGNWHNAMRAFTAHCVSAGYPDWIIIEASRQVLDNPADPTDITTLIKGARQKFELPDPGVEQAESAPLQVEPIGEFLKIEIKERKNLLNPWLPEQGLAMVYSATGLGKTHVGLSRSVCSVNRWPIPGMGSGEESWRALSGRRNAGAESPRQTERYSGPSGKPRPSDHDPGPARGSATGPFN